MTIGGIRHSLRVRFGSQSEKLVSVKREVPVFRKGNHASRLIAVFYFKKLLHPSLPIDRKSNLTALRFALSQVISLNKIPLVLAFFALLSSFCLGDGVANSLG